MIFRERKHKYAYKTKNTSFQEKGVKINFIFKIERNTNDFINIYQEFNLSFQLLISDTLFCKLYNSK